MICNSPRDVNMKTVNTLIIKSSAEKVWKAFAHDFDDAYKWLSSIQGSYGKDLGTKFNGAKSTGRVCELEKKENGMQAIEKFVAYDEATKTCTVEISFSNAPAIFPLKGNVLNFSVRDMGNGISQVDSVMYTSVNLIGYIMYPIIKFGFKKVCGQVLEELKVYVETGTPHQRKLKAMGLL